MGKAKIISKTTGSEIKFTRKSGDELILEIYNVSNWRNITISDMVFENVTQMLQPRNKVITKLLRRRNKNVTKILRKRNILLRKL